MDCSRRDFLTTGAAALATPAAFLLGEREATAVEEDCSWSLPDGDWHHYAETWDGKNRVRYIDGVVQNPWRSAKSVEFKGNTIAELGSWARGEIEYDKASEYLAGLLNVARGGAGRKPCKLDPRLMAESLQWAKSMARRRRMVHAPSDSRGGAAEIIAVSDKYTDAVSLWWNSRGGRSRGLFRRRRRGGSGGHYGIMIGRYTKIGVGVAKARGGHYSCARYA